MSLVVYFCCPQDVHAKALRILFLLDTISVMWLLCLYDCEVSRWTPNIFGLWTSGSCESSKSIFWGGGGQGLTWCVSGRGEQSY